MSALASLQYLSQVTEDWSEDGMEMGVKIGTVDYGRCSDVSNVTMALPRHMGCGPPQCSDVSLHLYFSQR